jgi:hypothetical protein
MRQSILITVVPSQQNKIVEDYNSGKTIKEIAYETGYGHVQITKILRYHGIFIKRVSDYRWKPTVDQEKLIVEMYVSKQRGIQFIANQFGVNWYRVREVLLKNKIKLWTRSEITSSNSKLYGATKGFSGRHHSLKTKRKMSKSQINNKNRILTTGPKSKYIETTIGKVQGSYEVAYLQQHFETSGSLPRIGKAVHTPYGAYIPDFDCENAFIEVKSPFTWRVCRGLEINQKGIKSNVQYKKIKWVDKNVKPVIVKVFENKEATSLFRRGIVNKQIVIDEIIYKNGKYAKLESKILNP